jgi:tetratricopeptide (TPR) repeat protein
VSALLLLALLQAGPAAGPRSAADHAGWWIEHYGVVDPGAERARRARAVFDRVAAAADKNGRRFPDLVLLQRKAGLFATALPDGTVLLSPEGLDLCYRSVAPAAGDARLAFVLGHELSHLARDDFWHGFVTEDAATGPQPPEAARARELQADSYGLLFLTVAGYAPGAVVSTSGSFLEDWAARAGSEAAESHPAARDRAEHLRRQLRGVEERLELYRAGVRLQQLGRPQDALLFLQAFQPEFPSREVFSAIGLSHLTLAQRTLASCDPAAARAVRLPTLVDPEPRGGRGALRGPADDCRRSAAFRRFSDEAVRHLEQATRLDPAYVAARVNLASALLLSGSAARALAEAESALRAEPASIEATNVKALALSAYGAESGVETGSFALDLLSAQRARSPADALTAFNLAALLDARGRSAAARDAWRAFLALEPEGPWAQEARRRLGDPDAAPRGKVEASVPPVPMGPVSAATEKRLLSLRRRAFDLGGVSAAIYDGESLRVVTLDDSVEVVEERLQPPLPAARLRARLGPPSREEPGPSGRLWVYAQLAFDVQGDAAVRRIHFVE